MASVLVHLFVSISRNKCPITSQSNLSFRKKYLNYETKGFPCLVSVRLFISFVSFFNWYVRDYCKSPRKYNFHRSKKNNRFTTSLANLNRQKFVYINETTIRLIVWLILYSSIILPTSLIHYPQFYLLL